MSEWTLEPTTLGRQLRWGELRVRCGDCVVVDCSAYTGSADPVECPVVSIAPGTASVYPIKARCPNGAPGQFKPSEVRACRRPAHVLDAEEQFLDLPDALPHDGECPDLVPALDGEGE